MNTTTKQITVDEQTGKLILSDSNNNHYKCNIYGDKLTEFLPYISGTITRQERKQLLNWKLDKSYENPKVINQYLPTVRKFEGYAQFPRPLTKPLSTLIKNKNNNEIIENILKAYNNEKVKKCFDVKLNQGLDYLTSQLTVDASKPDRFRLIKIIDDYFEDYKEKNKYKLNLMDKDPIIRALRHFKKFLKDNETSDVINNRKLPTPPEKIKNTFKKITNDLKKTHTI
jgi:hypothetical protein